MSEIKCAVCGAMAPDDLWDCGWIGVMADGTLVARLGESDAPLVAAPAGGSCLVCGEICLQLLIWRETTEYLASAEQENDDEVDEGVGFGAAPAVLAQGG